MIGCLCAVCVSDASDLFMVLRPVRRVLDIQMSRTRVFHHSYCKDGVLASFPTINNGIQYSNAGRPVGFYRISTTKKKPNIDHTALYQPNIDRKSSLKSAHLQYLLLSPEIYIFWENEAFREIWGISENFFNWGHLGKHCIWTTWILMEYRPFWWYWPQI